MKVAACRGGLRPKRQRKEKEDMPEQEQRVSGHRGGRRKAAKGIVIKPIGFRQKQEKQAGSHQLPKQRQDAGALAGIFQEAKDGENQKEAGKRVAEDGQGEGGFKRGGNDQMQK